MSRLSTTIFACALALFAASSSRAAIINGQVDDFEDGSVHDWSGGAFPINIATGGPAGAGDNYMQVTSAGGGGAGGSMATYNDFQWSGNYLANNVTSISVDMKVFSGPSLSMRLLLLFGAGGNFTSTLPVSLPNDGQWHTLIFPINAGSLTDVSGGFGNLNTTLSNLPRMMIRHQAGAPLGQGGTTPVAANVGFDNIIAIPEPGSLFLLAAGLAVITRRRR
jgi:hypothetical protein